MKIAIEGCGHGALDKIYQLLKNQNVELLIICGDFQAIRSKEDLQFMNVPQKFKQMGDFHKYYSGQVSAPVPTIFIGGNHEDSHYLDQLKFGGYVAPNIYYMGRSGVIWFNGLRIGALSGIFKEHDFMQSHPEYDFNTDWSVRKAYHVRKDDYLNLRLLNPAKEMIILSHDWPEGIYQFGDQKKLLKIKPYFEKDIKNHNLGNPYAMQLLNHIKPSYWFSAHLHVKFSATIDWKKRRLSESLVKDAKKKCIKPVANDEEIELDFSGDDENVELEQPPESTDNKYMHSTKFLALDKCIRQKDCLQIMEIPVDQSHFSFKKKGLFYDAEFISILKALRNYQDELKGLSSVEVMNPSVSLLETIRADVDNNIETLKTNKENANLAVYGFEKSIKISSRKEINPQTTKFQEELLL